ncbi:MAG: hypothetical protein WCX48_08485 [Bacteroidales bacterium]
MRLYIDDILVHDFDSYPDIGLTFDNDNIEDVDTLSTSRTTSLDVPVTPLTRRVFGHADNPHVARFNNALHTARLEEDVVINEGFAFLTSSGGSFKLNIVGAGKAWAVWAAVHNLNELTGLSLAVQDIITAWATNADVQMFHVQRDDFLNDDGSLRPMCITDMHPFFNVKAVFDKIFADAGYTVQSSLPSDVYFSDKVKEQDSKTIDAYTGFKAGRDTTIEATPLFPALRDTLTQADFSIVNVTTGDGQYNNGGFSLVSGVPTFTNHHSVDVVVLFRLQMDFETQIVYSGSTGTPRLPHYYNKFKYGGVTKEFDYKTNGIVYTPVKRHYNNLEYDNWIFDIGLSGQSFFGLTLNGSISGYTHFLVQAYSSNAYSPTFGWYTPSNLLYEFNLLIADIGKEIIYNVEGTNISSLCFIVWGIDSVGDYHSIYNDSTFTLGFTQYTDDGEYAPFSVDITSRQPLNVAPNESNGCGDFEFSQNNAHQAISIIIPYEDVTLETTFTPLMIGIGTTITPAIALSDSPQIDLLKAVKHMYNLRFITDEDKKIVYVYPRTTFYDGAVVDWSEKNDYSVDVEITELGSEMGKNMVLKYQDADSYVQDYNELNPELGALSIPMLHKFTEEEDTEIENPMFASSIIGNCSLNGSMQILYVDNDGNFASRVVKRMSVQSLSDPNFYPSTTSYPLVNFSSLGFDVMNYYTDNANAYNYGRRITLNLFLKTKDIEGFASPNSLKKDFRGTFLIKVDNEKIACRIEKIENFIPEKSTKCSFITI